MYKLTFVALAIASSFYANANILRDGTAVNQPSPAPAAPSSSGVDFTEGFDGVQGAALCSFVPNFTCFNTSTNPDAARAWLKGSQFTTPPYGGVGGTAGSFAASNFQVVLAGAGTHSAWLVHNPLVTFGTGATLEVFVRVGLNAAGTAQEFADRLQIRASSTTGAINVGTSPTTVGDFTTLVADLNSTQVRPVVECGAGITNPGVQVGGFPAGGTAAARDWCRITITSGFPASGMGRIAFRNFNTAGGPDGVEGNQVSIDNFSFSNGSVGTPSAFTATTPSNTAATPILLTRTLPASTSTSVLTFNVTGANGALTCTTASAGYSVAPSPLNLVIGTPGTVTVTHTGTTAGTFTGLVTCTGPAGSTGGPFIYNFSTTVNAAVVLIPTPALNIWGSFALLAGLGLFGAFALRRFS